MLSRWRVRMGAEIGTRTRESARIARRDPSRRGLTLVIVVPAETVLLGHPKTIATEPQVTSAEVTWESVNSSRENVARASPFTIESRKVAPGSANVRERWFGGQFQLGVELGLGGLFRSEAVGGLHYLRGGAEAFQVWSADGACVHSPVERRFLE